jgi:hypothetical protein
VTILENGVDASDKYEIDYDYAQLSDYYFRVDRRSITINTKSVSKLYDGTELTCEEYWLTGSLVDGDSLVVEFDDGITDIGTKNNTIKSYYIVDESGNNVTGNYNVSIVKGTLTVESD